MSEQLETRLRQLGADTRYPQTPDIAAQVMRQLVPPRRTVPVRRALSWAVAALLIAFAALLAVPPARAAVLEFIQVGIVRIFGPPAGDLPENQGPPSTATPAAGASSVATVPPTGLDLPTFLKQVAGATSLDAAAEVVDFPIFTPTYPEDIGEPDWVFLQDAHGDLLVLIWMDSLGQTVEMSLHVIEAGSWAIDKMDPQRVEETRVNGQRAIWAEGEYPLLLRRGDIEFVRLVEGHVLIWEAGNLTYRLESDLTLEEAVKVAESLQPISSVSPDS
jgi:hypothetical protein